MATVTISMRLEKQEVGKLADAARRSGMERPAFLKQALRRGAREMMLEGACQAYRRGEATLSRAAEMAGLSLREMLGRLQDAGLELNYTPDDLEMDGAS